MPPPCPICRSPATAEFSIVGGHWYYRCNGCRSLYIDPQVLAAIDDGHDLVSYSAAYWAREMAAARERAYGPALARVAEVFLYARRPIERFVDIGTGPGYLLDALATYLPHAAGKFYGIEKFPPPQHSRHPNYRTGTLADLDMTFDAGCCIEVLEHLTPAMVCDLAGQLAARSLAGSLYIFNTGLPDYVINEDPGYLDPSNRGHIVSYSLEGIAKLVAPFGFAVRALPGKTWAFLLEFGDGQPESEPVSARIWTPCPENVATLKDPVMGSVLYVLGLDTARAY